MASSGTKRKLSEIESDIEATERLKRETKERLKRLRTEKTENEEYVQQRAAKAREYMRDQLPSYLYEALVEHPMDPKKYGALLSFDISHEHHNREIKDGIYASQLLITARFEKKSINYERDTDYGSMEWPMVREPKAIVDQRPTMRQQELWERALKLNKGDVGLAFIAVCIDAYHLIDDFEDKEVDEPIREIELYRRLHCKLPDITVEELKEFYALQSFAWLTDDLSSLDVIDMERQLRLVQETRNLLNWEYLDEVKEAMKGTR